MTILAARRAIDVIFVYTPLVDIIPTLCKYLAKWLVLAVVLFGGVIVSVWADTQSFSEQEITIIRSFAAPSLPFTDTTNQFAQNPAAKKLGKQLFFDTRLSSNGKISCATCHALDHSLADTKDVAMGLSRGTRNTPTLINVGMQRWFFHDGRVDSLWLQAVSPIESKLEMGGSWQKVHRIFIKDKALLSAYNSLFNETPLAVDVPYFKIDENRFKANVGKAIAAYEMDFTQFNSRFDQYVNAVVNNSDSSGILSQAEQQGLKLFMGKGRCVQCHLGANFTDGEFHNIRLIASVNNPQDSGRYGAIDSLRENPLNTLSIYSDDTTLAKTKYVRKFEAQWAAFKTPTLRNIAFTAPYMHDGSMPTLRRVIEHYSTFQNAAPDHHKNPLLTPLNLSESEMNNLEAFLRALSGDINVPAY